MEENGEKEGKKRLDKEALCERLKFIDRGWRLKTRDEKQVREVQDFLPKCKKKNREERELPIAPIALGRIVELLKFRRSEALH